MNSNTIQSPIKDKNGHRRDPQGILVEASSASGSSSSSEYSAQDTSELKRAKAIAKKGVKMSKQDLKRMRNRQAAKKSRMLKKEQIMKLEEENEQLRLENERLQQELANLRDTAFCSKCTTTKTEDEFPQQPFEEMPSAEQIVSQHNRKKSCNRKTDDDMRYERITEEDDKRRTLERFFLVFALLMFILALTTDVRSSIFSEAMPSGNQGAYRNFTGGQLVDEDEEQNRGTELEQ